MREILRKTPFDHASTGVFLFVIIFDEMDENFRGRERPF